MQIEMFFEVYGEIPSIKNTLRATRSGRFFHKDDQVRRYFRNFAYQVPKKYKLNLEGPVSVYLNIVRKDKRKDAHNLMATIFDALEHAGVIKNDRQILEWRGRAYRIDKENPSVAVQIFYEKGGEEK